MNEKECAGGRNRVGRDVNSNEKEPEARGNSDASGDWQRGRGKAPRKDRRRVESERERIAWKRDISGTTVHEVCL